jgi:hypothetical protein
MAARLTHGRLHTARPICLADATRIRRDRFGLAARPRDPGRWPRCFVAHDAAPGPVSGRFVAPRRRGLPTCLGFRQPVPPSAVGLYRHAANAPVSGAAGLPRTETDWSPRPLHWRVRRDVAVPKGTDFRHGTRRGGPISRVHPSARPGDALPGDAACRQCRVLRYPRWSGDRSRWHRCSATSAVDRCG